MNTDLFVRFVQGRYPAERRTFRSQNILVNITGLDGTVRVNSFETVFWKKAL